MTGLPRAYIVSHSTGEAFVTTIPQTLGELERELAKRGARMNARCEPGKDHHRVLIMLSATVLGPRNEAQHVETTFRAESLEGALVGALLEFDRRAIAIASGGSGLT